MGWTEGPATADTRLSWLADVIPVAPIRTVVSAGDVVLLARVSMLVAVAMRKPGRRRKNTKESVCSQSTHDGAESPVGVG